MQLYFEIMSKKVQFYWDRLSNSVYSLLTEGKTVRIII